MIKLSVIILSYNTRDLLIDCIGSLEKVKNELEFEVIVVDNGSKDNSPKAVKERFDWVKVIESEKNLGFSAGNNLARNFVRGEYVLFLNSDTLVYPGTLKEAFNYLESHKDVGAVTCKIVLPNGFLDKDARRSFPTPWVAFTHFCFLDRLFPKSRLFSQYWYGYLDENKRHEIDALEGAFFLTRKKILDMVGWYDESFFLDGEDIDLSWRIKKLGYKNVYNPGTKILHIKKASKRAKKSIKSVLRGLEAMEIFYKKHLYSTYPIYINLAVKTGIFLLKIFRVFKFYIIDRIN